MSLIESSEWESGQAWWTQAAQDIMTSDRNPRAYENAQALTLVMVSAIAAAIEGRSIHAASMRATYAGCEIHVAMQLCCKVMLPDKCTGKR